jgi:hypothetical protein
MNAFKKDHFSERLTSAAQAKTAMLERFRARPGPDDPAVIERRKAQEAIEVAREIRVAERKAAREAEALRKAAEEAALAAEEQARIAALAARKAEDVAREAALAIERKAARDAKYAARIARRK